MSERLVIKNFGPIKHVELDIKKVNVLIGDQGTGKSAIARLLNLFARLDFLFHAPALKKKIVDEYGFFFQDNTEIEYTSEIVKIKYDNISKLFWNEFPDSAYKEKLFVLGDLFFKLFHEIDFEPSNVKYRNEYYSLVDWYDKTFFSVKYIPAERITVNTIRNYTTTKLNIDQYIVDYTNEYNAVSTLIDKLKIEHLNNVEYYKSNNQDWVNYNGDDLLLHSTSSGFQTSIPFVVYMEYFTNSKFIDDSKIRFIVEEPELSLFPLAQKKLIDYMINRCNDGRYSLFITTHSPYILTSLNNLMQAFIVGEKNTDKVNQIIDKKYWLNPNDVSAYMLTTNGRAENIVAEDGLIMTEKIDAVSDVLNGLYDKLLDINIVAINSGSSFK